MSHKLKEFFYAIGTYALTTGMFLIVFIDWFGG
jgi:hypothetical protein